LTLDDQAPSCEKTYKGTAGCPNRYCFGSILNLGRDATGAEIKAAVIEWIRGQVQDYERRKNVQTFIPSPFDPT
jgi:hypothetical protein